MRVTSEELSCAVLVIGGAVISVGALSEEVVDLWRVPQADR